MERKNRRDKAWREEGVLFIRLAPESRSSQTQRIYTFLQLEIEMEDQTDLHRAKPKEKKCRREKCDEEKIQEIWKVGDKEV